MILYKTFLALHFALFFGLSNLLGQFETELNFSDDFYPHTTSNDLLVPEGVDYFYLLNNNNQGGINGEGFIKVSKFSNTLDLIDSISLGEGNLQVFSAAKTLGDELLFFSTVKEGNQLFLDIYRLDHDLNLLSSHSIPLDNSLKEALSFYVSIINDEIFVGGTFKYHGSIIGFYSAKVAADLESIDGHLADIYSLAYGLIEVDGIYYLQDRNTYFSNDGYSNWERIQIEGLRGMGYPVSFTRSGNNWVGVGQLSTISFRRGLLLKLLDEEFNVLNTDTHLETMTDAPLVYAAQKGIDSENEQGRIVIGATANISRLAAENFPYANDSTSLLVALYDSMLNNIWVSQYPTDAFYFMNDIKFLNNQTIGACGLKYIPQQGRIVGFLLNIGVEDGNLISNIETPFNNQQVLSIYPNPTSEYLHFNEGIRTGDSAYYSIFDSNGRTLKTGRFSPSISVSDIPKGVYFITVKSDLGHYFAQFIKN